MMKCWEWNPVDRPDFAWLYSELKRRYNELVKELQDQHSGISAHREKPVDGLLKIGQFIHKNAYFPSTDRPPLNIYDEYAYLQTNAQIARNKMQARPLRSRGRRATSLSSTSTFSSAESSPSLPRRHSDELWCPCLFVCLEFITLTGNSETILSRHTGSLSLFTDHIFLNARSFKIVLLCLLHRLHLKTYSNDMFWEKRITMGNTLPSKKLNNQDHSRIRETESIEVRFEVANDVQRSKNHSWHIKQSLELGKPPDDVPNKSHVFVSDRNTRRES